MATTKPRAAAQAAPRRAKPAQDVQTLPEGVKTPQVPALTDFGTAVVDTRPPWQVAQHVNQPADPYPHPPHAYGPAASLWEAGRRVGGARQAVESIDVMRAPPEVQVFKAEVLAWLDRRGAA